LNKNDYSIIFVGTSSGQTSLKRFHSSLLVKSQSFNLLIDCGDGISKGFLSQNISLDSIDGILFSHLHPDHSAGFPSLIVQMKQLKRTKLLKIFCHKNLTETLRLLLYQTFVFTERSSFELEYYEFEHGEKIVLSKDFHFISKQNSHLDEYANYINEKKIDFACSSFLLTLGERNVYYSGDIGSNGDLHLFEDQKPEIMITEATHIKWKNILDFIEAKKPEKIYLTHLNNDLEVELKQKIDSLSKILSKKIMLAFDSLYLKL
jgi:ribonuclease BN (tRNA processing enzyme)